MKIGLMMPSVLMAKKYNKRVFAPRELFLQLLEGLDKRGHDITVYSTPDLDVSSRLVSGSEIFEKQELYSIKDIYSDDKEARALLREGYEYEVQLISKALIDANRRQLDILHNYFGYFASYFSALSTVPVVTTIHDLVFPKNTFEYQRYNFTSGANYSTISKLQKSQYLDNYNINIIDTVYHGIEVSRYDFSFEKGTYLSFLGRLVEGKGFEDAILSAKQCDIELRFATSENYKTSTYFEQSIKPLFTSKIIEHPFLVGDKEKSEFLKNSIALLFPIKWQEPFGMVLIEAMASGCPVIAYANGAVPEIVEDGVTGFIVNESENNKTGNWMIQKVGIEGLREAIGRIGEIDRRKCREHVEQKFNLEQMIDGYEALYSKVLNIPVGNK